MKYWTLLILPIIAGGCSLNAEQRACVVEAAVDAVLAEDVAEEDMGALIDVVSTGCGVNFRALVADEINTALEAAEETEQELR